MTSLDRMKNISSIVSEKLSSQITASISLTKFTASLIESGTINYKNLNSMLKSIDNLILNGAANIQSVQSAIWADETGNFVVSHKLGDNGRRTLEIINRFQMPVSRLIITKFADGHITKQFLTKNITVDQRKRPWYIAGKTARKTTITDFFQYTYLGYKVQGIDIVTPVIISNQFIGTLGLYMRIDYLKKFIENLYVSEHGIIFITTEDGQVLAFPKIEEYNKASLLTINQLPIPWVTASFNEYKKTNKHSFLFKYKNKDYLAIYNPMRQFGKHRWLIAVVAPQTDFTAELKKINMETIFFSLIILLISILTISKLSSHIVKPLNKLTKETEYIKNFNLNGNIEIFSRIKEIILLRDGLSTMKKGLRSFQKYVPASLVRQIIKAGSDAKVGGSKRKIATFFSDIKDFTSITQKEKPAELMSQLNQYFNALSECIDNEKGTIDKYIGDSIMAFWGAPLKVKKPAQHAANAALKCIQVISRMNDQWIQQGLPPLVTRIGIHLGDSIVGNVGSSKRMNYTAIGDSINVASRLESINKFYGTTIIVSDAVYQEIKNSFVLRFIDKTILQGTSEVEIIYQLLTKNKTELLFDIDQYNSIFIESFNAYAKSSWDEAIDHFEQCLKIYKEDTIAPIFINRCKIFKSNPPKIWDGVWRFQSK